MPINDIKQRLSAADPTTKAPHRVIGLLFSILQWIAFAATIQAIGIRVDEPLLRITGYILFSIVVLHTARITWFAVGAAFAGVKFRSDTANMAVRLVSLAFSVGVTIALVRTFRSAASELILFYSKS